MRTKLFLVLLCLPVYSCRTAAQQDNLFQGITITAEDQWLLTHNDNYGKLKIINDQQALREYYQDLTFDISESCHNTTPDYCVSLYRNGREVNSVCYCEWEPHSISTGRLESFFKDAHYKKVKATSIALHNHLLDSLKSRSDLHLLYPVDTTIQYPAVVSFTITIEDKKVDIHEQEKPIEEEFRKLQQGDYAVNASFYASYPGKPTLLSYKVAVECDSSFLDFFDLPALRNSYYFKDLDSYRFQAKEFSIRYIQVWAE